MVNATRLAYEKVTATSLQPCKNIYYFCIQIFLHEQVRFFERWYYKALERR